MFAHKFYLEFANQPYGLSIQDIEVWHPTNTYINFPGGWEKLEHAQSLWCFEKCRYLNPYTEKPTWVYRLTSNIVSIQEKSDES